MIRKILIVVLTLAACGVLIPAYLTRATAKDDRIGCWCSDFVWKGQVAFEYGHMIVFEHMPASGVRANWCDVQSMAGKANMFVYPQYYRARFLRRLGFLWMRPNPQSWFLSVPLWFLFLLFGAYPAYAFLRGPVLRNWRRKRGLCTGCSYNLTGNESGVCPECGTKIDST